MFGVGCSFDDSPEERDLRNDIMDQACRGWFSSGAIEEGVVKVGMNDASRDGIMGGNAQDGDEEEGETAASASGSAASGSASAGSTPNWMRSSKQHQVPVTLSDDDMFMTSSSVSAKCNNHERRNSSLVQNIDEIKKRRRCRKRE